ncbi:Na(+)/H(+) antiporter NhaA 2 [Fusarium austroafricanum]|uniref:Na(+)/H(+) antiporter NhaA 2 n=1 Tax=Fusarium austroafricanum TaxID=2364996 RepID=A0A8H4KHQ1_9HYPO|nr:Na(+)/H(+) antiporter NhaA 2 [Fusarium austroafricanum]
MIGKKWLKFVWLILLLFAFMCSSVLGILALSNKDNIKAGIATLQFQLSTNLIDSFLPKRTPQSPDFIDIVRTAIDKFPDAVSRVQTAAGITATSIPDLMKDIPTPVNKTQDLAKDIPELIEELFPKNFSVGTERFCVGLSTNISCSDLPLNITHIIPPDIARHLGENVDGIRALDAVLAKITAPYLRRTLAVGMVSTFAGVLIFAASLCGWPSCFRGRIVQPGLLYIGARLVFGLVLSVPFFIPTVALHILRSKLEQVPSWIQVQQGNVLPEVSFSEWDFRTWVASQTSRGGAEEGCS